MRKRYVGWIRRLSRHYLWREVTIPLEFNTDVWIVLARRGYWDGEEQNSRPGWSTLVLHEGETPEKRPCK